MIESIIFDWGGVLIENPKNDLLGYFVNYFDVPLEVFENSFNKYFLNFQKGIIKEEKFWKNIKKDLSLQKDTENLWYNAVKATFKEKPKIISLLYKLKKNYSLFLLSNSEKPAASYFFNQEYSDYFESAIFSCHFHMIKPDKEIYDLILYILRQRYDLKNLNKIIFIDDTLENVKAAKKAGINSLHFKNYEELLKDFKEYNILL